MFFNSLNTHLHYPHSLVFLKFIREIATAVQSPQTPQSATLTDDEGAISQIIAENNFAAINSPTLPSVEIAVKKML